MAHSKTKTRTVTKKTTSADPFPTIRTLADLGLTTPRAWAMHSIGYDLKSDVVTAALARLPSDTVRVLHKTFGLIVVLVTRDIEGDEEREFTGAVFAVAMVKDKHFPQWREIGSVSAAGEFLDVLDTIGGDCPSLFTELFQEASPQKGAA